MNPPATYRVFDQQFICVPVAICPLFHLSANLPVFILLRRTVVDVMVHRQECL